MKKLLIAAVLAGMTVEAYAYDGAFNMLKGAVTPALMEKLSINIPGPVAPAATKASGGQIENPQLVMAAVAKIQELSKGYNLWAFEAVFEGVNGRRDRLSRASMNALVTPSKAEIDTNYWWGNSDSMSYVSLVLTAGPRPSFIREDERLAKVRIQVSRYSVSFQTAFRNMPVQYSMKLLANGILEWTEIYPNGTVRMKFMKK